LDVAASPVCGWASGLRGRSSFRRARLCIGVELHHSRPVRKGVYWHGPTIGPDNRNCHTEIVRVRAEHGSQSIFAGSYGWSSAGRLHHARSLVRRFYFATGGAVDCFLHAVEHLYTMCRQVKSIEIIEFGYEKSADGVNGAKSEYCVDKHRQSIVRPYQSALREASGSRSAQDLLKQLHELWVNALVELKWKAGENDDEYKARVAKPYDVFQENATAVRAALVTGKSKTAAAASLPKGAN
jgi:hypothetical protein